MAHSLGGFVGTVGEFDGKSVGGEGAIEGVLVGETDGLVEGEVDGGCVGIADGEGVGDTLG